MHRRIFFAPFAVRSFDRRLRKDIAQDAKNNIPGVRSRIRYNFQHSKQMHMKEE